jgi:hypothetical protein
MGGGQKKNSHTSNTKNSKNEDIRLNPLNFKGMHI